MDDGSGIVAMLHSHLMREDVAFPFIDYIHLIIHGLFCSPSIALRAVSPILIIEYYRCDLVLYYQYVVPCNLRQLLMQYVQ